jgi:hypothetical protein
MIAKQIQQSMILFKDTQHNILTTLKLKHMWSNHFLFWVDYFKHDMFFKLKALDEIFK